MKNSSFLCISKNDKCLLNNNPIKTKSLMCLFVVCVSVAVTAVVTAVTLA